MFVYTKNYLMAPSHTSLLMAFISACSILLSACSPSTTSPPHSSSENNNSLGDTSTVISEEGAFSFDQMFKVIREKKALMVVYGSQEPAHIQSYKTIGEHIKGSFKTLKVLVKADDEVAQEDWQSYPMLFLGSPKSNRWIGEMMKGSPFKVSENDFSFNGKNYKEENQAFAVGLYPSPKAKNMPFSLVSSNSDRHLLELLEHFYGNNWRRLAWGSLGYQVFEGKQRLVMGDFSQEAGKRWTVDGKVHWDFDENTELLQETKHFKVIVHGDIPASRTNRFMASCEENINHIIQQFGWEDDFQPINYHLYASSEEKGLLLENTDRSHIDFSNNEVHTVLNEVYADNEIGKELELLFRQVLGKPKAVALEAGLAIHFAPKWQRFGASYWMARLQEAGQEFPLVELLDDEQFKINSSLTFGSGAGAMVAFLMDTWGQKSFLEKYPHWQPSPKELEELSPKWRQYLAKLPQKYPKKARKTQTLGYAKGFNFAHEGYRIYNGYGSTLANRSLDYLKSMHSNAIAIVPYSYMGDANQPSFLRLSQWAGSENDEGVAQSAYYAQQQGMSVLLKPQIWFGRGSWPGDLQMKSEEDWQAFFGYYNRWISHYAMLAEIYEMEAFCLGVEFAKATIERPTEWKEMAQDMRKIYQGQLTYAANWGDEVEKLNFWEAFDYIGVNCYYPLSEGEQPTDKELAAGFQQTLGKLSKILTPYKRPVLFTEIGFRSVEQAWKNPHAGAEGRGVDLETQARCYRVVCDALSQTDWCQGVYWWKWPSYMTYAQQAPDSFSPTGKPAEKVVEKWFREVRK